MKYLKLFENYFPDNEPTTEELKQMLVSKLDKKFNVIDGESITQFTLESPEVTLECEIFYNEMVQDYEMEIDGETFSFTKDDIDHVSNYINSKI